MKTHLGRWFRFYESVPFDPKIQTLGDSLGFFWVNCLCLASTNSGILPKTKDIAWTLRKSLEETEAMLRELCEKGLLDDGPRGLAPHNWEERQFQSDLSTDRVRRHREQRKRSGNVSETVSGSSMKPFPSVSVSVSEYVSESKENGRYEIPSNSVADDFEDWWESVKQRHPKSKDFQIATVYVLEIPEVNDRAWRFQFDANHILWCNSPSWRDRGGQFAPSLAQWVLDKGYKYPPKAVKTEKDRLFDDA